MIIYQGNYQNTPICARSIDLLISSIPLAILKDSAIFFQWVSEVLADDGILLIDCPHDRIPSQFDGERWYLQWTYATPEIYTEDSDQCLACFTRGHSVPAPDRLPYQKHSHRKMHHSCEFDPMLIKALITHLSTENAVVLDPFCGTGTVPRIARDLNRQAIGIDLRCPFTNEC